MQPLLQEEINALNGCLAAVVSSVTPGMNLRSMLDEKSEEPALFKSHLSLSRVYELYMEFMDIVGRRVKHVLPTHVVIMPIGFHATSAEVSMSFRVYQSVDGVLSRIYYDDDTEANNLHMSVGEGSSWAAELTYFMDNLMAIIRCVDGVGPFKHWTEQQGEEK